MLTITSQNLPYERTPYIDSMESFYEKNRDPKVREIRKQQMDRLKTMYSPLLQVMRELRAYVAEYPEEERCAEVVHKLALVMNEINAVWEEKKIDHTGR